MIGDTRERERGGGKKAQRDRPFTAGGSQQCEWSGGKERMRKWVAENRSAGKLLIRSCHEVCGSVSKHSCKKTKQNKKKGLSKAVCVSSWVWVDGNAFFLAVIGGNRPKGMRTGQCFNLETKEKSSEQEAEEERKEEEEEEAREDRGETNNNKKVNSADDG